MNTALRGTEFALDLPVTLSPDAQRQALLATGREVERDQVFELRDLQSFPPEVREEIVSLRERIRLSTDPSAYVIPGDEPARVIAYGTLHQGSRDRWEIFDPDATDGESTEIDRIFFSGGPSGRTRTVLDEFVARRGDDAPLHAVLAGAPLVDRLESGGELTLTDVLDAYARALLLASEIETLAYTGTAIRNQLFSDVLATDELVVFIPSSDSGDAAVGFLRETDPETFTKVAGEVAALSSAFPPDLEKAAAKICHSAAQLRTMLPTDAQVWEYAVKPNLAYVATEGAEAERQAARQRAYTAERDAWISRRGSRRLKLAAERGYKHDGIYRDERLATELPGFVALKGKFKVGEDVNPSEQGIEAETETLERVAKQGLFDAKVRLVWVSIENFPGPGDGEYVEVSGYLGRHTVYLPVSVVPEDEIRF